MHDQKGIMWHPREVIYKQVNVAVHMQWPVLKWPSQWGNTNPAVMTEQTPKYTSHIRLSAHQLFIYQSSNTEATCKGQLVTEAL